MSSSAVFMTQRRRPAVVLAALGAALALTAATSPAATFYLRADVTTKTIAGHDVYFWGFALDSAFGALDGEVTIPGPVLRVPPGDTDLTIYLDNNLTAANTGGYACPVSLIVRGLPSPGAPVRFNAAVDPMPYPQFEGRIRSLSHEAMPGNPMPRAFTWTGLRPGTFIYHSGTHMQCHVQMGLYGALIHDAAAGEAYPDAGGKYAYDNEALLLYSEIDLDYHATIGAGQYGPGKLMTSTVDYEPDLFLINGTPFSGDRATTGAEPILDHELIAGERLLVRLLNAGLKTRVPTFLGQTPTVVAEDGYLYPYARDEYSINLPALQTKDAFTTAPLVGTIPIVDSAMGLSNAGTGYGGMIAFLEIATPPEAAPDEYVVVEYETLLVGAPGVLANDSDLNGDPLTAILVDGPSSGALTLNPDGSFEYVAPAFGLYTFTYKANDGGLDSNVTTVTLRVRLPNRAPVAVADAYELDQDTTLNVPAPGVLGNDSDEDADPLAAVLVSPPASGGELALNANGSFVYTPPVGFIGVDAFSYAASDGAALSTAVVVSLTVKKVINFRTQIVKMTIPASASSVNADAPAAFLAVNPARTIVLLSGVTDHAMGATTTEDQTPRQISARVELVSATRLTATRAITYSRTTTIWALLIEYTGTPGGANELLVRDRRVHNWTSGQGTTSYGPIASVVNPAKVVVFSGGSDNANGDLANFRSGDVRAYLDGDKTVRLARGNSSGVIRSALQVVEFTGANWSIQTGDAAPAPHIPAQGTDGGGTDVAIADVGDVSRAWIYYTMQTNSGNLDERGHRVWLTSPTNLRLQEHASATATKNIRWYVIRNAKMTVTSTAADFQFNSNLTASITVSPVLDTTRAFAWVQGQTSGGGDQHPRDMWQFALNGPLNVSLQRGRSSATLSYRCFVVQLP